MPVAATPAKKSYDRKLPLILSVLAGPKPSQYSRGTRRHDDGHRLPPVWWIHAGRQIPLDRFHPGERRGPSGRHSASDEDGLRLSPEWRTNFQREDTKTQNSSCLCVFVFKGLRLCSTPRFPSHRLRGALCLKRKTRRHCCRRVGIHALASDDRTRSGRSIPLRRDGRDLHRRPSGQRTVLQGS